MSWHYLVISGSDVVADASLTALANKFASALQAEIGSMGGPVDAPVYIQKGPGSRTVYFSPSAFAIGSRANIFVGHHVVESLEPPDVRGFKKINA